MSMMSSVVAAMVLSNAPAAASSPPSPAVPPPPNALLEIALEDGARGAPTTVFVVVNAGCSSVEQSENQVDLEVTACRHGREDEPPTFAFTVVRKTRQGPNSVHQSMKANARLLPGTSALLAQWPTPGQAVRVSWRVPPPKGG